MTTGKPLQYHSRMMAYLASALLAAVVLTMIAVVLLTSPERLGVLTAPLGILAGTVPALVGIVGWYMKKSSDENIAGIHS